MPDVAFMFHRRAAAPVYAVDASIFLRARAVFASAEGDSRMPAPFAAARRRQFFLRPAAARWLSPLQMPLLRERTIAPATPAIFFRRRLASHFRLRCVVQRRCCRRAL